MSPDDSRPDPDALAEAAAREGKGRLRVFLGAAPGVGKTWEMLSAARRRRDEGVDVVAGIVETHGRAETEAQLAGLTLLPRKAIAYRGQVLEEFDVDAALARRPGLLLVDELAHTNAPGSRHAKRWEDVAELLHAGIDVWATLNVQHLESLNETVAKITGVRVTETLPDRVLELADEIEVIDLTPSELRARLMDGKIYRSETARRALNGFFREGNLTALREIALRQAAQRVDQDVRDYMRLNAIPGPWPAGDRVLALVGGDATAMAVVRHAKRLADALRAPWIALHVERGITGTGGDGGSMFDARAPLSLAAQLGADIEVRAGQGIVGAALDLAAKRNVTQIVIGRSPSAFWRRVLRKTLAHALLREAPDFALHVVPAVALPPKPARRIRLPAGWLPWLTATGLVAAVVGIGEATHGILEHEALGMLFLAAVVTAATLYGLTIALTSALLGFLSWNFFFIPPIYQLTIYEPRDVIAIFVFAGVATSTGWLASRVRAETRLAQARIDGLRRIAAFSRRLGEPTTEPEMLAEIARQAADIAGRAIVLSDVDGDIQIRAAIPPTETIDEGSRAAARWANDKREETGRGTATLPSASWRFLPMQTVRGLLGVLGVRSDKQALDPPILQALGALADQAAVALERVRLANEAARSAAQQETQKLRTALLNSLSHDLRTPLTGIRGAADTLRDAWDTLPPETRRDLLESIGEDIGRMSRFLGNIMDLSRLESGQIAARIARVPVDEVIEAAISRVPDAGHVGLALPEPPPAVLADAALLAQVLVNVLDNARKYSPVGGLISVRVGLVGAMVAISVVDEGVGIPPEDLPHVFDSFYRARRGDRVAPGTGLGLAIARGLVEAMGGTIEAVSPRPDIARDASPGTSVTVRLPLAPPVSL